MNLKFILKNKLTENFIALGIIQITNYAIGFIQTPLLIKIVGLESFGAFSIAWTLSVYVSIFADFGYNYYAISIAGGNKLSSLELDKFHSTILYSKIFLSIVSSIIISIFAFVLYNEEVIRLLIPLCLSSIFQVFFPVWFFQCIEKIKIVTIYHFSFKVLIFTLILLLVKEKKDVVNIGVIYAIVSFLQAIFMIHYLKNLYHITFKINKIYEMYTSLRKSFYFFVPTLSTTLISNMQVLILGITYDNKIAGGYSAAEKVIMLVKNLNTVLTQSTLNKVTQLIQLGNNALINFYRKILILFTPIFIILSFLMFNYSSEIAYYLNKIETEAISLNIKILCFVPLIVFFHYPFYQYIVGSGKGKSFSLILGSASILSFLLYALCNMVWGEYGVAVGTLLIEIYVLIALYYSTKSKINILNFITLNK